MLLRCYGEGGPLTCYVVEHGKEEIIPMTVEEAKAWAEEKLDGDEYIDIFGDPEENNEKATITIEIPKAI